MAPPHHSDDGNEPFEVREPDWARLGPRPTDPIIKVGDPTRWGSRVNTHLPNVAPTAGPLANSTQIIQAQTADPYARPWSVIGIFTCRKADFDDPGPASPLTPFHFNITPYLEVAMGVGQAQLIQYLDVRALINFAVGGEPPLMYTNPSGVYRIGNEGGKLQYPFYLTGLIGRSVSIRAQYWVKDPSIITSIGRDVGMTLAMMPLNAGTGL